MLSFLFQVGVLISNGKEYPIYAGINTIGRHGANNIVFKDTVNTLI